MKWDIDKALASYGQPGVLVEHSIARVLIPKEQWKHHRLNPKPVEGPPADAVLCWSLGIGRWGQPKLFAIALTLREAHLRLRKLVLKLDPEQANLYGVRVRPKRKKFERRDQRKKVVEPKPAKKKSQKRKA